jgi:DNA-binding transcriptional ArsR family regulator
MNDVYRALGDPTRRRILELLRGGDMTAGALQGHFRQSWPTISGHLRVLREADLVQADRAGTTIRYHLNLSLLEEAMLALLASFGINREVSP